MDPALLSLVAASVAFVGTHFALSHPLRAPLVSRIGERPFLGLYSVVAIAGLWWMTRAFRAAPSPDLAGSSNIGWAVASALTVIALVLFLGSLRGNPAFPSPAAADTAHHEPAGVFRVTRHPMMWGFALWAAAHMLLWWSWRTVIVAGAILVLALLGAHLQDRKKARLQGAAWIGWQAKTSYWPRWHRLASVGWLLWVIAVAAWLGITWLHIDAAGVPAGLWRWVS
ncbi:NnrU family protein [Aurantiacibacter spongiae]|uniref:MFS transporter n=1 Tax=Aurantiacibacter spongiae TaxID=2488860 RepID=A0A3N5CSZ8_9SPHN|nr:NnrU family protein [Aurantiacibacter spongiae]RPF71476.1 MFS transporter [Aurantiacibacter spongiae]